jgi:hypothetical protein
MNGMIAKLKSRFVAPKARSLTKLLSDFHLNYYFDFHNFFMSASSNHQANQMFESHIKATKQSWIRGGYIFVSSRRAPDVLRILARQKIKPVVIFNVSEKELKLFANFLSDEEQSVRVYIEDDRLPADERSRRFQFIQQAIIDAMKVIWTPREELTISDAQYQKVIDRFSRVTYKENRRLPIVFDLDLQTRKGFSVLMTQAKRLMSFCIISHKDQYQHAVDHLNGFPEFSEDEHKSMLANTVSIYGSGPINHDEVAYYYEVRSNAVFRLEQPCHKTRSLNGPHSRVMTIESSNLKIDDYYQESNHAIVFFGGAVPTLVDLSK